MAHLTPEGLFLRVNPKFCEMTGYRPDELTQMSFRDVTLAGDYGADDEARRARLATHGGSYSVERRYVRKNGAIFWVHIVTTMLSGADGASRYGLSVIEDITLRKRTEFRMQRLNRLHALVSKVSEAAIQARERRSLFELACRIAVERGGLQAAHVVEIDASAQALRSVASDGVGDASARTAELERSIGASATLRDAILAGQRKVCDATAALAPGAAQQSSSVGRPSGQAACFPLHAAGRPIGALVVAAGEADYFLDDEVELLTAVANCLGLAAESLEAGRLRQRAEERVLRQDWLLASAGSIAGVGSWDHDLVTGRLEWSDETLRIFGIARESFEGTAGAFLQRLHPDDRESLHKRLVGKVADSGVVDMEYRILRPDGEERVLLDRGTAVEKDNGVTTRRAGTVIDITERRRAETQQARHADRMAALVDAQRELATTDVTLEQLLQRIPALALGVVDGAAAIIDLIDGDAMVCRAGSAAALDAIGMRIPIDEGFSGETVRMNRTLRCDDTETDPRVASVACRAYGLRSVLATVVRDHVGPIGVLKIVAYEPAHFGAAEADSLEMLAEALGAVIQRKRAEEEAQHSIRIQAGIVRLQQDMATSQGDLQAKLDQLIERTQELTGAAGAVLVLLDGDEMVYRAGSGSAVLHREVRLPRAGSLLGLTIDREEPLLCDDSETDPGVNREVCRKVGARSMATAPLRVANAVVGVLAVVSGRSHAFGQREVGTLQMLAECLGVVMQREAAALRLQMSESQYRLVFATNPLPMWVFDTKTLRFLAVNDASIAHYGYTNAEFLSMTIRDIRTPNSARALDSYLAQGDPGGPLARTLQHRTKDGTAIEVEVLSNALRFTDRAARLVLVHDVTERKRAERDLRNTEAILAIAGRVAHVAGWSFDLSARVFAYSVELCEMHDLPAGSAVSLKQALDFYAPESRPAMLEAVNACAVHGTPYDLELEIITARGRRIGVRTIGQAVRDAAGVITGTQGAVQDITERRAAQVRQAAESLRFDTALNNISQGVCFFDGQQRLIVCNRRYAEMYGLSLDLVRPGTTLREIVEHRHAVGSIPDMTPAEYLAWRNSLVVSNQASDTVTVLKNGRTFAIQHQPMPDSGWVATHEDITERRASQEALRSLNESLEAKVTQRTSQLELTNSALASKEEEIRSVVEHMADGVVTFDDNGIVRAANPMIEVMFGHPARDVIGRNVDTLVPALSALVGATGLDDAGEAAVSVVRATREARGRHRNGDGIALEVGISHYRIKGQRLWTAILRDIGERVAIMADLEQARCDAEQASRAKSAFVATMSHEIRTPMNGVIGMIDVLEQTELAPDQARMLDLARDSAYSLMGIIEEILDFSKIEAGKVELECEPISVAAILGKVSALVAGVAASKGVEVTTRIDAAVPSAVWGDALRVRQVLVNLVNNAIKFSSGRGVSGRVAVRVTTSRSQPARVMLDVAVEDNGIGMDAATIGSLFKPFSQADASTTRRFGGTGLGLAITRQLVELMGGEILVSSTPDVGSTFTVRLPFEVASGLAAADTGARSDPPAAVPGCMPRRGGPARHEELILVAEDNEINQHVITAQLKLLGFKAEVVGDGREALVRWRSGRFAMLLTDLQMPEMDGYDLTAGIRGEEGGRARTPIVALTANALKDESNRCKAAGMDDYLTKPVPLATLEAMLLRWLKAPRAHVPALAPPSRRTGATAVDPAVLTSLVGDDPAVQHEFFVDFARAVSRAVVALESAVHGGRREEAASLAHQLKASARAIGALELGEQCAGIEAAAGSADDVALSAALPVLQAEVAKVRDWIEAHCAEATVRSRR